MKRTRKTPPASVVAGVQEQTDQAAALAGIAGQDRLADPRLNPATRGRADELRVDQHLRALDAGHSRSLRRLRVSDARAAEAEETLQAIALARRASSPARSVWALHNARRVYARLTMAASVVLAAGSAMGVEEAAQALGAPTGTGYVAEVGLTGLSTVAITYRAHLAEHRGELEEGTWQFRALWALMVVPLLVSVAANLAKTNAIGAACAIGAGAFALLSCVIADRSAAAMADRAAEVSGEDEDALRAVVMDEDPFVPVAESAQDGVDGVDEGQDERLAVVEHAPDGPLVERQDEATQEDGGDGAEDAVSGEARAGVAELAAWLADREPPAEGAPAASPATPDDGPAGAALDVSDTGTGVREARSPVGAVAPVRGHIDARVDGRAEDGDDETRGHIESDLDGPDDRPDGPDGASRVLAAAEARRAVGASTRHRILEYLDEHPDASNSAVAAALELSAATVKRHRRELRQRAGGER